MSSSVQWSREGALAVIRVNNPPVNALSHGVRVGLLKAFRASEADAQVQAVLLVCEGTTFIAGADIREFGTPPQTPTLPTVTLAIENFSKPSVAAIHGSALGGGLEVALACHYRIAHRDARLGFPEVKLGLLPGAGGTQRLPRLAGLELSLDMILGGEPVTADEAERNGIVDGLFEGEPLAAAQGFAAQLLARNAGPRRSGHIKMPAQLRQHHADLLNDRREQVRSAQPQAFAPLRCICALEAAINLSLEEGLGCERALFLECMASPQRAVLVEKFFAERQAAKARRQAATDSSSN